MEDYDYMWIPKHLAVKLKELENENDLFEKEVLCYVEKTKLDISQHVEFLDDDILMFKAKLASYKKLFKEAYATADEEMYSFWEKFDLQLTGRSKSISSRLDRITHLYDEEFEKKKKQIEKISSSMEHINTYAFERIITFLKQYESLEEGTKDLFTSMVCKKVEE